MSELSDLFTLMKCNKRTVFWLLMQSYKPGTWIALVVKEHLPDLEMLQAIRLHSFFFFLTLIRSTVDREVPPLFFFSLSGWSIFWDVLAGGVSVPQKASGLERKQLLRNEHRLEGQAYLSLTSLWDCSINTMIDL